MIICFLPIFIVGLIFVCCIVLGHISSNNYVKNNTNYNKRPTYLDLLDTKEWKEKRKSIIERDGYKCSYCGCSYNLNVHHKYYLKYPNNVKVNPWEYSDDALITLCDKCHKKVHQKKKIKTYYTKYR